MDLSWLTIVQENDAGREQALAEEFHIRFLRLTNTFVLAATTEELHAVILSALTRFCSHPPAPSLIGMKEGED
jgi:hypothetical protein